MALGADPSPPDMQQICNDLYVNTQSDPSKWQAEVINASSVDSESTAVPGTEQNINFRPDTSSTFVYAGFVKADDPLTRTGGSVNMWGQSVFSQKIWDNTLYDVQMDFTHTVTFYWTCHVSEYVTTVTHVGGGGDNPNGNNNGGNLQDEHGNLNGNQGCGNGNGGPVDPSQCGGHDVTTSEWVFRQDYPQQQDGGTVDDGYQTTATDQQLAGHVEGVNYTEYGDYRPAGVRSLACINPGKKGGTWTKKNNYTGVNCNTTYFNSATTAYGTTFDTITGTLPSASLPSL